MTMPIMKLLSINNNGNNGNNGGNGGNGGNIDGGNNIFEGNRLAETIVTTYKEGLVETLVGFLLPWLHASP